MPVGRSKRGDSRFRDQANRLSARLRSARIERGLTQEQLAARAQVAVSTLRKIESGQVVEPGYFTVLSLASALALGLGDLQDACEPTPPYREDDHRQRPRSSSGLRSSTPARTTPTGK
ncbi:helix-turn-helix domain-containing protein [Micromonospora arborensis]|uniref:helix-turn-helix domain-containing protein n=1 Tax=Micromonospora arborensis TaxID=2116518 RepID=UPI00142E3AC9|nr:helix-turn-helix transcriptional regulator [Micromonospora arborensis]